MTREEVQTRFWNKNKKQNDEQNDDYGGFDDADRKWLKSRQERGQGVTGHYLMEKPDGSFIDAEDADISDWCRFMNQARELDEDGKYTSACNVKPFLQTEIGGETHEFPRMYAVRDIDEGEELCWDYGEYFFIGGAVEEK